MIRIPSSGSFDTAPTPFPPAGLVICGSRCGSPAGASDDSSLLEPRDFFLRVAEDLRVHLRIVLSEQRRRPAILRRRLRHVPEPEGDLDLANHRMLHLLIELPGFELSTAGQVGRGLDDPEKHAMLLRSGPEHLGHGAVL